MYGLVKNYNYNIIQKHTIFVIFFRFCDANIYIHGSGEGQCVQYAMERRDIRLFIRGIQNKSVITSTPCDRGMRQNKNNVI